MVTKTSLSVFMLFIFAICSLSQDKQSESNQKVSAPGIYKGYSTEEYDSFYRESQYVKMSDGVRIAVDIYRPQKNGIVEQQPLPVIWLHTRYTRSLTGPQGNVLSLVSSPVGMTFIKHGYILVIADARGTGASFGTQKGIFTSKDSRDAYDITEWIASRKWCNGNVGMTGGSYEGVTQLMAAKANPPHLKAIFPAMFLFDLYDFPYHNGVYYEDCIVSDKAKLMKSSGRNINFISPVDSDTQKKLLKEAHSHRSENRYLGEFFSMAKYRNSYDSLTQCFLYKEWSPSHYLSEINKSGVAVYIYGGWFDLFSKDAFMLYTNLTVPRKLLMVDSPHSSGKNPNLLQLYITEQLRWFDYWLRKIPNGIMDEHPVALQKIREPDVLNLTFSDSWPLNNLFKLTAYFHKGKSGSVNSKNDGILDMREPGAPDGIDVYNVDFSTSSGTATRWDDAAIKKFNYPDMAKNDEKGLTYSASVPLQSNLTICGHPVVTCYVSSSTPDFDLFAYLEDVDINGVSKYLTEGCLRASFRKLEKIGGCAVQQPGIALSSLLFQRRNQGETR
jgi:putative CocE/NonD family hydrolase